MSCLTQPKYVGSLRGKVSAMLAVDNTLTSTTPLALRLHALGSHYHLAYLNVVNSPSYAARAVEILKLQRREFINTGQIRE
jgi:hypothetical protein